MKKHLLFIPFLALLGTSCGGGHITTTPVVRNAPSTGVLNAPNHKARQNADSPSQILARVDLGTLNYGYSTASGHERFFSTGISQYIVRPSANSVAGKLICQKYQTDTSNNVYNHYADNTIAVATGGDINIYDTSAGTDPTAFKESLAGVYLYFYANRNSGLPSVYTEGYNAGYTKGYNTGFEDGGAYNQQIVSNGQYTGLTAFPRRSYLERQGVYVLGNSWTPSNGSFDMIDTNGNYTIYIKWTYDASQKRTYFQDDGNTIIGELFWGAVANGNWSTSWFGKYDAELHYIASMPKYYATDAPITMSFYPEVYLASTLNGDVNTYFMGGGNAYQMGFADGQTYTIQASDTYNNVFNIFVPAFRAVASFFNMNIGPFKIWYFFAIPLIVSLLILVLRLVKH